MFVVDAEAYLEVPYRKLGELLKRSTPQSKAVQPISSQTAVAK